MQGRECQRRSFSLWEMIFIGSFDDRTRPQAQRSVGPMLSHESLVKDWYTESNQVWQDWLKIVHQHGLKTKHRAGSRTKQSGLKVGDRTTARIHLYWRLRSCSHFRGSLPCCLLPSKCPLSWGPHEPSSVGICCRLWPLGKQWDARLLRTIMAPA